MQYEVIRKKVKKDPRQKFKIGDKVRINTKKSQFSYVSSEYDGLFAYVQYSYAQAYPENCSENDKERYLECLNEYSLNIDVLRLGIITIIKPDFPDFKLPANKFGM